jgi:large subunit ribosomal protein L23
MGIFSRKKKKEPEEVKKITSIKDEKKKEEKEKISSIKTDKKIQKKDKKKKQDIKKDIQKEKKEEKNIRKSFSHLEYVIKSPHITEKATDLSSLGQYVFKVADNTNKEEIKKAISDIYNVKVEKVRIIKIPSKTRRFRRNIGKKSGYKKAIVKLKEGYSIEIIPGAGVGVEGEKK